MGWVNRYNRAVAEVAGAARRKVVAQVRPNYSTMFYDVLDKNGAQYIIPGILVARLQKGRATP